MGFTVIPSYIQIIEYPTHKWHWPWLQSFSHRTMAPWPHTPTICYYHLSVGGMSHTCTSLGNHAHIFPCELPTSSLLLCWIFKMIDKYVTCMALLEAIGLFRICMWRDIIIIFLFYYCQFIVLPFCYLFLAQIQIYFWLNSPTFHSHLKLTKHMKTLFNINFWLPR